MSTEPLLEIMVSFFWFHDKIYLCKNPLLTFHLLNNNTENEIFSTFSKFSVIYFLILQLILTQFRDFHRTDMSAAHFANEKVVIQRCYITPFTKIKSGIVEIQHIFQMKCASNLPCIWKQLRKF